MSETELNTSSEANLIEKLARGDEQAFSEIYRPYRNRVYGFVYRMTADKTTAEDLFSAVTSCFFCG